MDLTGVNQFFFGHVTSGLDEALIFVNVCTLPAFLDSRGIHMDGTFRKTPRGFYQLATVHAMAFGLAVQVVCFFMTAKTQRLYEICLRHLIEVCLQLTGMKQSSI